MTITPALKTELRKDALERFLRYVRVDTISDENSEKHPSTEHQRVLAKMVAAELEALGVRDVEVDEHCYVYGRLPARGATSERTVSFLAHLDTSPAVSGADVKPVLHEDYRGGPIRFADDPELVIDPKDCPELQLFVGDTIITASGKTLLGADDKAGIAEILAGLAALQRHPELKHPELRLCFTPDEEIGAGTAKIRKEKLGEVGYTFDGSIPGELEDECFDARLAKVKFTGMNVHPGQAKGKMVNAGAIAARFVAALPEAQSPEHTEMREGFFHLIKMSGNESDAELQFLLRDFVRANNDARIAQLHALRDWFLARHPGLKLAVEIKDQYRNMKEELDKRPEVTDLARQAIERAQLKVIKRAIRGGTDGAKLSFMGVPTPNIFAGGMLFHSKKEWIAVSALEKAAEVFLHLCELWAEAPKRS